MSLPLNPVAIFKALADDTRLKSALLIAAEGELCVCELMVALDDSQPKISRHLALLRSLGLMLDRREGQWVYYRLNPENPAWINTLLADVDKTHHAWLADSVARLNAPGARRRAAGSNCESSAR